MTRLRRAFKRPNPLADLGAIAAVGLIVMAIVAVVDLATDRITTSLPKALSTPPPWYPITVDTSAAPPVPVTPAEVPNADPRRGWVYVAGNVDKICDGPTLVYDKHGALAIVPNSPECQP